MGFLDSLEEVQDYTSVGFLCIDNFADGFQHMENSLRLSNTDLDHYFLKYESVNKDQCGIGLMLDSVRIVTSY